MSKIISLFFIVFSMTLQADSIADAEVKNSGNSDLNQAVLKAAKSYLESCNNDSESGCSSLATIYKMDIGVNKDPEKANYYMQKASLLNLYGSFYNQLTEGQKEYLIHNYKLIGQITQSVLNRYGNSRIPLDVRVNDKNTVQFYLHPDGSLSDLQFIQKSNVEILNDTTRETIELSYFKYPRPSEEIPIRYRIRYDLDKNESAIK
jgi:hypothetical protein